MRKRKVVILGSTGSIGINTLKVLDRLPQRFEVEGLTANNNIELLSRQIKRFKPKFVACNKEKIVDRKGLGLPKRTRFFDVTEVSQLVESCEADIFVLAISGGAALAPFLAAAKKGARIAPANKEALVMAGTIIMETTKKYGATIIPIDSEQSAIFQCLEGRNRSGLKKILLTASGGPLNRMAKSKFPRLSVQQILKHPRWKMGKKITVDSATLINKGFEVIEAKMLFGLGTEQIEVVIHPEALIHSMTEFQDGSILAQLGVTDMRLPIQYALTYPDRLDSGLPVMDFGRVRQLTFETPDERRFPCLGLAFFCARQGGTLPCVLNAADEIAVNAFLQGTMDFTDIYTVVEKVVNKHRNRLNPQLKDILAADTWARQAARNLIK